jgi:hypothetical protein
MFGSVWAAVGLLASTFIANQTVASTAPMVIYALLGQSLARLLKVEFAPSDMLLLAMPPNPFAKIMASWVILLLLLGFIYVRIKKKLTV